MTATHNLRSAAHYLVKKQVAGEHIRCDFNSVRLKSCKASDMLFRDTSIVNYYFFKCGNDKPKKIKTVISCEESRRRQDQGKAQWELEAWCFVN